MADKTLTSRSAISGHDNKHQALPNVASGSATSHPHTSDISPTGKFPLTLHTDKARPQPEPTVVHTIQQPQELPAVIKTLPKSQRRLLASLTQVATNESIWTAFRSRHRINIASDGGLSNKEGTFGWVIATKTETLFQCSGPVDSPRDTSSSTCSELCGYASALLLIATLAKIWKKCHRCKFRWIVNSKATIQQVLRHTRRGHKYGKQPNDIDLMTIIIINTTEIKQHIKVSWIKGHQDDKISYDRLPLQARLNIDVDFLATRQRQHGRLKSNSNTDHQAEQRISISINNTRIQSQFDDCNRFHVNGYHLRQYMQSKHKWTNATWDEIDFESFGAHF
jgi:hypothetical protein